MYSVGTLAYYLLTDDVGYKATSLNGGVKEDGVTSIWEGRSQSAKNFIGGLTHLDPTERMSAEEALQHEFLKSASRADKKILPSSAGKKRCRDEECSSLNNGKKGRYYLN